MGVLPQSCGVSFNNWLLSHSSFTSLPTELIDELKNVASEPQQGCKRIRLLCATILREITPTSQLVIADVDPPVEQKWIPIILPLVWVQVGTAWQQRMS